jgi:Protein of unknown function (DUF1614)
MEARCEAGRDRGHDKEGPIGSPSTGSGETQEQLLHPFQVDALIVAVLGRVQAPMASVGGAGTFDGVFVAGIIAVLLAAAL